MNRMSSLVFLGLLLVALSAIFTLCFHVNLLFPECQVCMSLKHSIFPAWWVVR